MLLAELMQRLILQTRQLGCFVGSCSDLLDYIILDFRVDTAPLILAPPPVVHTFIQNFLLFLLCPPFIGPVFSTTTD